MYFGYLMRVYAIYIINAALEREGLKKKSAKDRIKDISLGKGLLVQEPNLG